MRLIQELRDEHSMICGMLQQVLGLGIVTPEARNALALVKARLLSHMERENAELYPVLRASAKSDVILERQLRTAGEDLESISALVSRFFDKYSAGGPDKEFARDLGAVYAALTERIRKEETVLFREYSRLKR